MKQHIVLLSVFLMILTSALNGQNSANNQESVIQYGPHSVDYEEFKRGFMKNQTRESVVYTAQDVQDYLELYTNFKLKVQDAFDKGLDTTRNFKGELNVYRKQIARPFLTDKAVTDKLLDEAYGRYKYEVDASHILITVKNFDNVYDTLKAYKYLDSVRNLIVSGKMDFGTAAEKFSQDPSAKSNKGNLGYFTAFQMVYPFETQAFSTPKNQVSPIFKTDFGYHILKVHDKKLSAGEIKVAHLMLLVNMNASEDEKVKGMEKAQSIYEKIKNGEKSFEEMVKLYSEDNATKNSGGKLEAFRITSQYPPQFKTQAFALENDGDVSEPFYTGYGIHIVKRLGINEIPSFESLKNKLTQDINRDSRSYKNTLAIFDKVAKQLHLKQQPKVYARFMKKGMNNNFLEGNWEYKAGKDATKTLFSYDKVNVTVSDFANHLLTIQTRVEAADLKMLVQKHYDAFVISNVMSHYEENLETYNKDYKYLLQEYKEGILLFSLMDEVVWSKSMDDSVGLQAFFEERQSNYMWDERLDVHVFATSDAKVVKMVETMISKGISNDSIVNYYTKVDPLSLTVRKGKFSKGEDDLVDQLFDIQAAKNAKGTFFKTINEDAIFYIHRVNLSLPASPKNLDEIKGPVISEYQDLLESKWIEILKVTYPVSVNQALLDRFLVEINK